MNSRPRLSVILLLSVGLILAFFVILFPALASVLKQFGLLPASWYKLVYSTDPARIFLLKAFFVLWFGFVGACFGSFLNVVAARLPRGRSVRGSSHCPSCGIRLRFLDNTPIIGWLINRGKCRDCDAPIALRYLVTEMIVCAVTFVVAGLEIICGGLNLPGFESAKFELPQNLVSNSPFVRAGYLALHLTLIYLLFTFAVIRSELLKLPRSLWWFGIVFGLVLPTIHPPLAPLTWEFQIRDYQQPLLRSDMDFWLTVVLGGSSGAVVGFAFSALGWYSNPSTTAIEIENSLTIRNPNEAGASKKPTTATIERPETKSIDESVACFSLIGLCLGWQLMLISALMLAPWFAIGRLTRGSVLQSIFFPIGDQHDTDHHWLSLDPPTDHLTNQKCTLESEMHTRRRLQRQITDDRRHSLAAKVTVPLIRTKFLNLGFIHRFVASVTKIDRLRRIRCTSCCSPCAPPFVFAYIFLLACSCLPSSTGWCQSVQEFASFPENEDRPAAPTSISLTPLVGKASEPRWLEDLKLVESVSIDVVDQVRPAVVAIQGGSGVIIDRTGLHRYRVSCPICKRTHRQRSPFQWSHLARRHPNCRQRIGILRLSN